MEEYAAVLQRANQIAASETLDELLNQMLEFLMQLTHAQASICHIYDAASCKLSLKASRGSIGGQDGVSAHLLNDAEKICDILTTGQPLFVPDTCQDATFALLTSLPPESIPANLYCLPLHCNNRAIALVQLAGLPPESIVPDQATPPLLQLILDRLATEIDKAHRIEQQNALLYTAEYREKHSQYREAQLEGLIDFISRISTTLEREELISIIMDYAEELLGVETTSFWLLDEKTNRLKLLVAGAATRDKVSEVSVALGEGIIGHVVQTGEMKVVNDVRQEPLFNTNIDMESGFVTRSILSVPMKAPRIQRGDLRGEIKETIIGGAQALNKRDGTPFTEEDIRCFETLSRQAAIAFQFSHLFEEDNTLFWGVVKATTAAIDLIDPYTRGHSDRVSDFSVAIAEQLGLPPAEIYRIRVGSMLHDVGKIGVDPQVLKKPGRLTEEEFREMQRHPTYGVELFKEAGLSELLREELQALAQHHERLDGKGYPNGLSGDEISFIGRIVAVADIFDALTSDRPYRSALPVEEVFDILEKTAGTELDTRCVAALIQARARGKIKVQHERMGLTGSEAPKMP